jgi:hypothetical protein
VVSVVLELPCGTAKAQYSGPASAQVDKKPVSVWDHVQFVRLSPQDHCITDLVRFGHAISTPLQEVVEV